MITVTAGQQVRYLDGWIELIPDGVCDEQDCQALTDALVKGRAEILCGKVPGVQLCLRGWGFDALIRCVADWGEVQYYMIDLDFGQQSA